MARYRAASAMAPIPFDRHGVPGTIEIVDEFLGLDETEVDLTSTAGVLVNTVTAQWTGAELAGDSGASVEGIAGVADHPGIARLSTGATTAADGDLAALALGNQAADASADNDFVLDSNGLYIAAVLRIPDVDAQKVEFGLAGQALAAVNSSAADIVSFVWDPEDAANVADELFLVQVNGAGTDVEEAASLVPYVQSDWVLLEIAADSSSATFRITTEDNTQTIVLDGTDGAVMPTVDLRPFISVEAVGAAEELVDIDVFVLRYIRRDALVAGWLGA